ncbi:MAG: hypothetical protein HC767_03455 [Akkermansiaceae bacterium]|nr:hypothetical protein [Akkermansiaceae bacterium]
MRGCLFPENIHRSILVLVAGQAVIQFAKDRRNDLEYAVKFYLSHSAFTDEASLYTDRGNPLGEFLPEVRNIVPNVDGKFVDAFGAPMAPCIAMEKGESLDIWSARSGSGLDMITALQVCTVNAVATSAMRCFTNNLEYIREACSFC